MLRVKDAERAKILVTGDINLDLIVRGLQELPAPGQEVFIPELHFGVGGSAANTAVALAKLGERVSLHGQISDDHLGRYLVAALQEAGVDISLLQMVPGSRTGVSIGITSHQNRSFISFKGNNEFYRAETLDLRQLAGFSHLHIAAFNWPGNLKAYARLLQAARERGLTTSLDTGWFDFSAWREGIFELLSLVDIFFPNEDEAKALTRKATWEGALEELAGRVRVAVVTRGREGVAVQQDRERLVLPAFKVASVDAVGAGDAFAAGFLYAHLQGWTLAPCATWASACGALAASGWGGAAAAPTADEVRAFLAERGVDVDECLPAGHGGYCFTAGR